MKENFLEESLNALLKDDLFKVLAKFDIKIAKSSLKGKLVEKVLEAYKENPTIFLTVFSEGTIDFICNCKENTVSEKDFAEFEEFLLPLQSFGFISKNPIKDKKNNYYLISEWFIETIKNLTKSKDGKSLVKNNQELEMLILGACRFYGVISENVLLNILKNTFNDLTLESIHNFIEKRWMLNIFISKMEDSGNKEIYFVSDSVFEPVDILNEVFKYENLDYKIISNEELKKYWGYFYIEKSQEIADLITLFMNEKLVGGTIGFELTSIIDKIKNNLSIDDIVEDTKTRVSFSSKENENIFKALVKQISLTLPLWTLKGHTYSEVFGNTQQPRNVEKIGRNEPCPCGSGKKYKKCCGK